MLLKGLTLKQAVKICFNNSTTDYNRQFLLTDLLTKYPEDMVRNELTKLIFQSSLDLHQARLNK